MYSLIIILPLCSSLSLLTLGRYIGVKGSKKVTESIWLLCWIISIIIFTDIKNSSVEILIKSKISYIYMLNFNIGWEIIFDKPSTTMLVLITTISLVVQLYSYWYLHNDPHLIRFISYIQIFTLSMIILVVSNNFLIFFIGWEIMGLMSYLLINFWSTSIESNKSSFKAILYNRIGDISLIYSIISLDLITFSSSLKTSPTSWYISFIFFFIAALAKSALFFFHGWLVSAMQGPTPVSALLHSSTMVCSGIYLFIRISPLYELKYYNYILIISSITIVLGSLSSFFLYDIKKIIALSTCSQIGYMFIALGLSGVSNSLFHLFSHGYFKALLFLLSGILIHSYTGSLKNTNKSYHSYFNEQDYRKFGGLLLKLRTTYIYWIIGSLSLFSFPYLSGYYSKESILSLSLFSYSFVYFSTFFGACLTTLYSLRLIYFIFYSYNRSSRFSFFLLSDAPYSIYLKLFILLLSSIFIGYILKDYYIGPGIGLTGSLDTELYLYEQTWLVQFPLWLPILFLLILNKIIPPYTITFPNILNKLQHLSNILNKLQNLSNRRFFIESLINSFLLSFIPISKSIFSLLDSGFLGSTRLYKSLFFFSNPSTNTNKLSVSVYSFSICTFWLLVTLIVCYSLTI